MPLEYIPGPSRVILSLFGNEQPCGGAGLLGFQRFEVVAGILIFYVLLFSSCLQNSLSSVIMLRFLLHSLLCSNTPQQFQLVCVLYRLGMHAYNVHAGSSDDRVWCLCIDGTTRRGTTSPFPHLLPISFFPPFNALSWCDRRTSTYVLQWIKGHHPF